MTLSGIMSFFYVIGDFEGVSYNIKDAPRGCALARTRKESLLRLSSARESAGGFFVIKEKIYESNW